MGRHTSSGTHLGCSGAGCHKVLLSVLLIGVMRQKYGSHHTYCFQIYSRKVVFTMMQESGRKLVFPIFSMTIFGGPVLGIGGLALVFGVPVLGFGVPVLVFGGLVFGFGRLVLVFGVEVLVSGASVLGFEGLVLCFGESVFDFCGFRTLISMFDSGLSP